MFQKKGRRLKFDCLGEQYKSIHSCSRRGVVPDGEDTTFSMLRIAALTIVAPLPPQTVLITQGFSPTASSRPPACLPASAMNPTVVSAYQVRHAGTSAHPRKCAIIQCSNHINQFELKQTKKHQYGAFLFRLSARSNKERGIG